MALELTGIHHLTAVSANIKENKRFYTQDLGMRLVKRSVNQDDVSAYHLFYSDKVATPGNDLTFFDWHVHPAVPGNHSISRTSLRVLGEANLRYWRQRFQALKIASDEITERDGRLYLDFTDHEGQRLSLVTDGGAGDPPTPWERSPVPAEHQIRGLGPIILTVPKLDATDQILQRVMNAKPIRTYPSPEAAKDTVHVYQLGQGGPHAELHVAVRPDLPHAKSGAGGVHHVAFRTPTYEQYDEWLEQLNSHGVPNSGKVDRYYFRSLYFREPNGILFEIATDGPGFGVDEDLETLGEKVILPPRFENQRDQILAGLKPIDD